MNNAPTAMGMMDCMGGMMWGMGLIGILGVILLVLGIVALTKFIISGKSQ